VKQILSVFRCEYRMSIRRWSLWLSFGVLSLLHMTSLLLPTDMIGARPTGSDVYSYAGSFAVMLNFFMPVVGGILAADRLVRDQKLGVDELLQSTPVGRLPYVIGKFLGVSLSIITPVFLCSLLISIKLALSGSSITIFPAMLLAFFSVILPTYFFITAYSLVCPLVMPVRVYQVLFTGYWFWGNLLSPKAMPTINGTYLTANGIFVISGFFGGFYGGGGPDTAVGLSQVDAIINLVVLSVLTLLPLLTAERVLAHRATHK